MSQREPQSDSELKQRLRARLDFYEELGLTPLLRRQQRRGSAPVPAPEVQEVEPVAAEPAPVPPAARPEPTPIIPSAAASTLSLFEEKPVRMERETLEDIRTDLGDCQRCKLARHRKKIVFGQGNPRADLVFVGEGPGAEEDIQGLAFVGRAGRLLTHWVEALGLTRDEVYICNVIKCRPPANRTPEKDEVETCSPFLYRQLDVIRPTLVCCLGGVALQTLLGKTVAISRLRGQFFEYRGTKLTATYHPAYILRNPNADRQVREDLRKIRDFLS
jgi:uracil-DNA glycosylase family 4